MKRREYLTGLAGLGALSAMGQASAEADANRLSLSNVASGGSYHPGPPRFLQVGDKKIIEGAKLVDPVWVDANHGYDRDNLAPSIAGEPQRDPEEYSASDFSWSVTKRPDNSTATIQYAAQPYEDDLTRWGSGQHNVAEFVPDVPGQYVLELDAPDGKHEQLIHAFPREPSGAGGPPRISLEPASTDGTEFVLDTNPKLAPDSRASMNDIEIVALADSRDSLKNEDVTVDGTQIRVPKSAIGDRARIVAAAFDGDQNSVSDTVALDAANDEVDMVNRPPEWIENGIMYEVFTRSFGGPPEPGEWPLKNSNATFENYKQYADYIDSLNVDVVWFTPAVPSESGNWKRQNWKEYPDRFKYVGGGPHGYDALSYYQIASDLSSTFDFDAVSKAPWPWEDGYDPENNAREQARQNAMQEYKEFIDELHKRDIKVCFDFVINHGGRHHPFFQDTISSKKDWRPDGWTYRGIESYNKNSKYFDWFDRQVEPLKTGSGKIVDPSPPATGFFDLRVMPQWDYSNVAVREHLLAAAAQWAEMGVDAFRCDIAWGVPHSFWKEIREVVKSRDSDFMLLDESIPNDPDFAEDEFDLHFDTSDFMKGGAHSVVKGADPMKLYDMVAKRQKEGWPEHTLLINATENHDEQRLFKIARNDDSREDPAKAQRAAWAAGVALPGVPFVYYGQERLITKYGENRYNFNGKGNDPRSGDVGPGNYKRAYMNWDTPESKIDDHLDFYRKVTKFYQESDILKPHTELTRAWFRSASDVLVFGRSMETDTGEKNVIVMINFEPGKATVDLLPGASTTDEFTGNDIGVDSEGTATSVEVETMAVVETNTLFSVGEMAAEFTESTGDDYGPGSYTYPTGDAVADGAFDMSKVSVHDGGDTYQFRIELDGPLQNPWNYESGVSVQFPQIYLRDPDATEGTTNGRTGTNISFDAPYQHRIVADPKNGVVVEDHTGSNVADGSLMANPVEDVIVVEVPKRILDKGPRSYYLAPLLFGYDPDADGNVMDVASSAGKRTFGGAKNPDMAPRVIDAVVPKKTSQKQALSYTKNRIASVPYTPLVTEFTKIATFDEPAGDDHGPGNFTYPTGPDGTYPDGTWDITGLDVYASRSRYELEFSFPKGYTFDNPWGAPLGFSHQFFQIYVRDPDAGDDVPSSNVGRTGLSATFEKPYHYRIIVNGWKIQQIENANGDIVTSDVNVSLERDTNTISFDFPKSAVGGTLEATMVAPLLTAYDGYGTGTIRAFAAKAGTHTIGTSGRPTNAPHVMDMITPDGTTQAKALSYSSSTQATIPYVPFKQGRTGGTLGTVEDPKGDDYGPGTYTYPTKPIFTDGIFDVNNVTIRDKIESWEFELDMASAFKNPWGGDGFCLQAFQLYVRDPDAAMDVPTATEGRTGVVSTFAEPYHYRVVVNGFSAFVENANGKKVAKGIPKSGNGDKGTITFRVPKDAIGGGPLETKKVALMTFGYDGYGTGGLRAVGTTAKTWQFGGAKSGAVSSAPTVIDLVGPETVIDQKRALSYSEGSPPVIPLYTVNTLIAGDSTEEIGALPGGEGPPTNLDDDPALEDVTGDGEGDIEDVRTLLYNDDEPAVRNNVSAYDFDGDGDVDVSDVLALFREVY